MLKDAYPWRGSEPESPSATEAGWYLRKAACPISTG